MSLNSFDNSNDHIIAVRASTQKKALPFQKSLKYTWIAAFIESQMGVICYGTLLIDTRFLIYLKSQWLIPSVDLLTYLIIYTIFSTQVVGLDTNIKFLTDLARHPRFVEGDVHTDFIEVYLLKVFS